MQIGHLLFLDIKTSIIHMLLYKPSRQLFYTTLSRYKSWPHIRSITRSMYFGNKNVTIKWNRKNHKYIKIFVCFNLWWPWIENDVQHTTILTFLHSYNITIHIICVCISQISHPIIWSWKSCENHYFMSLCFLHIVVMCLKHVWCTYKYNEIFFKWLKIFHPIYTCIIHVLNTRHLCAKKWTHEITNFMRISNKPM
jgi:hypothetical protein